MAEIAFIGLGNMGGPMAANLVRAGHSVRGFDLSDTATKAAAASGITIRATAAEAVQGAAVVITMLPAGRHVVGTYPDLIKASSPGTLFIDSSTIDVESARAAHKLAEDAGMISLDAPVSGGVGGAQAATLTFMAGGEAPAFAMAEPVLSQMGKRVVHCGAAGAGQAAKILQQHDPRHFDDRRERGLRARRGTRPVARGALRRRLHLVRPMLVAHHLLPGAGSCPGKPGQPRLQAWLRRGVDAEGPPACRRRRPRRAAPAPNSAATPWKSTRRSMRRVTAATTSPPSSTPYARREKPHEQPRDYPHRDKRPRRDHHPQPAAGTERAEPAGDERGGRRHDRFRCRSRHRLHRAHRFGQGVRCRRRHQGDAAPRLHGHVSRRLVLRLGRDRPYPQADRGRGRRASPSAAAASLP